MTPDVLDLLDMVQALLQRFTWLEARTRGVGECMKCQRPIASRVAGGYCSPCLEKAFGPQGPEGAALTAPLDAWTPEELERLAVAIAKRLETGCPPGLRGTYEGALYSLQERGYQRALLP